MKLIIPILLYFFLGFIFTSTFSNSFLIGICSLILYILFSITYFKKTFLPFVISWFESVINNHKQMEKVKEDESMKNYIGFVGRIYIALQNENDDSGLLRAINKVSILSFLVFPLLVYVHYKLYEQMLRLNQ